MDVEWWIQQIQEKMDRECISQTEVAKAAKISRQRVYAVLRGKNKSRRTVRLILRALGLGGKESATGYD